MVNIDKWVARTGVKRKNLGFIGHYSRARGLLREGFESLTCLPKGGFGNLKSGGRTVMIK